MPSKKAQMREKASTTERRADGSRLRELESPYTGYRVIGVSVYPSQANWIEQITTSLKQAGDTDANKSLIVREAIFSLKHYYRPLGWSSTAIRPGNPLCNIRSQGNRID